uniref:Uncharacterized protein n=1 Tax=Arundo donax TaxID=35708 RepID=A0A0A8YSY1_ARUDO
MTSNCMLSSSYNLWPIRQTINQRCEPIFTIFRIATFVLKI